MTGDEVERPERPCVERDDREEFLSLTTGYGQAVFGTSENCVGDRGGQADGVPAFL